MISEMNLPSVQPIHILRATVAFVVLIFLAIQLANFILETDCYDGQGSAVYIDKSNVQFDGFELKDLNFDGGVLDWADNASGERYFDAISFLAPDYKIKNAVATVSWNCPGTVYSYKISENGTLKVVDSMAFRKYLDDYAQRSPENLIKLYQSGNSPVFIRKPGEKNFVEKPR